MWESTVNLAAKIGLVIGGAGGVVLVVFLVWREIRKNMRDALEPLTAEVRPQAGPAIPGPLEAMSLRTLVELATSSITNIHDQLGSLVTITQRLEARMSEEQAHLLGQFSEHKRLMEAARAEDRKELAALALRVKAMESTLGKRGYDTLMEQHAAASVAIAEALAPQPSRDTPPTGVPKVQTDKP